MRINLEINDFYKESKYRIADAPCLALIKGINQNRGLEYSEIPCFAFLGLGVRLSCWGLYQLTAIDVSSTARMGAGWLRSYFLLTFEEILGFHAPSRWIRQGTALWWSWLGSLLSVSGLSRAKKIIGRGECKNHERTEKDSWDRGKNDSGKRLSENYQLVLTCSVGGFAFSFSSLYLDRL